MPYEPLRHGGVGTPTLEPPDAPREVARAAYGADPHGARLYVSPGCEVCAEAEARVQAAGIAYVKIKISRASTPGRVMVWNRDPAIDGREMNAENAPAATPALVAQDAATGAWVVAIGLDAVDGIACALARGASLLDQQ